MLMHMLPCDTKTKPRCGSLSKLQCSSNYLLLSSSNSLCMLARMAFSSACASTCTCAASRCAGAAAEGHACGGGEICDWRRFAVVVVQVGGVMAGGAVVVLVMINSSSSSSSQSHARANEQPASSWRRAPHGPWRSAHWPLQHKVSTVVVNVSSSS